MDPNELRQKKQECLDKAQAIEDAAKATGREVTEEETAKQDEFLDQAEQYENQAQEQEAQEQKAAQRKQRMQTLSQQGNRGRQSAASEPEDHTRATVKEPEWTKDPMKGFESPREFFKTVLEPDASDERLNFLAAAGTDEQQAGSDPYGGFLVPEAMMPGIESIAPEQDPFAGRTTTMPMESTRVKVNARVDKNHTESVAGGLTVSRSSETASKDSSRMQMEQVKFEANSLFGFSYATEELLRDSPLSVAALLSRGFRDQFSFQHAIELLRGNGNGEPEGIQNSPALITVSKEGSQAADTIVGNNLLKMRTRCWRFSQAIWLANHDTYPQLAQAHVAGTNGDVFLYQPGRGTDVPDTLLGRPVIYSEYMETLGDKNDLMLVVPSEITEGTYQPLESAESMHVRFDRHERAFKFWLRNDARSLWRAALTPNKSSNTLSPFVTLAARA